jgi:hypothetical protein
MREMVAGITSAYEMRNGDIAKTSAYRYARRLPRTRYEVTYLLHNHLIY